MNLLICLQNNMHPLEVTVQAVIFPHRSDGENHHSVFYLLIIVFFIFTLYFTQYFLRTCYRLLHEKVFPLLLEVEVIEHSTFCLETLIWGENRGLRCCWQGEVKLIQNSWFLSHSHYSPMFPEKKVGKNTFRAFTGKLEKPIDLRCRGGGRQFRRLDDTLVITARAWATDMLSAFRLFLIQKYPVMPGKLRRKIWFCFHCWQKCFMSRLVCAQRLAESLYLPFFPHLSLLFQPLMSSLSLGWNRIPLCSATLLSAGSSGTMTSILPDISVEIRIFLKEDISRKSSFRVISLSRSNRVSFGRTGTKVAMLEMCSWMTNLF